MKALFKKGEPESVSITLPPGALGGWDVLLRSLEIAKKKTGLDLVFNGLIEQIEGQLPKPKPEEPTGLGAVVEDENGYHWVRVYHPVGGRWHHLSERECYDNIPVVKVLSEGVPE